MKDYFGIGKIISTHGLSGEILLHHALGKETDLKDLHIIFIEEKKDSFLPYFVVSASPKNDTEVYIKLEGFNTKESARRIVQKEVWILKADFDKYASASSPISLLGYIMVNEGEEIGEVIEVIEQPLQVLCKIIYKGSEALIPIHKESLKKIDKNKKQVYVHLPDGLLKIYSGQ